MRDYSAVSTTAPARRDGSRARAPGPATRRWKDRTDPAQGASRLPRQGNEAQRYDE